ncbi:SIS domain-containing protein [Rhizobium mongolense]|uniref:SIS domain-containing protein n=1 Tax=Rhizobium mongolense TaxID=57676 RepID=UPI001F3E62A2|nr:SIS domain-containing protein [Rhizobium mongolense]
MQAAEFTVSRGAKLIALTDSELSPIANLSKIAISVQTETPAFFHTMAPAFAAVECLVELIAVRRRAARFKLWRRAKHILQNSTHMSCRKRARVRGDQWRQCCFSKFA